MFWENLNSNEQEIYAILLKKTSKWIAWISTKPDEQTTPEPPVPSDEEWIEMDRIAFKGWSMFPPEITKYMSYSENTSKPSCAPPKKGNMFLGWVLVGIGWAIITSVVLTLSAPYLTNKDYWVKGFEDQLNNLRNNYSLQRN